MAKKQTQAVTTRDGNGRFLPGVSGAPDRVWKPGESGNPSGTSKLRKQFESEMYQALTDGATSDAALEALRKAVRAGEPWAIQLWFAKVLPPTLRLEAQQNDTDIDWSRLTDEQLSQLQGIVDAARPIETTDGREVPALTTGVHQTGMDGG